MKKILTALLALVSSVAIGATLNPIQLLNPAGSTSGQIIQSTGPSTAPAWGSVDPLAPTTPLDFYVSPSGNDSNTGTSWGTAKLTLQAAVNAANPGGVVHAGAGTYSLTANLLMKPGVRLLCTPGATITQPTAQNLTILIDFSTNSASNASMQGCTIDGNRANNTDSTNDFLVYVGAANDVTVSNNTIRNSNGYGIDVSTGLRPIISYNKLSNFYAGPIYVITGAAQTGTRAQIIGNSITGNVGQHAITLNNSDWNIVSANTINASIQTGMTVNTAGTTVTLTAGPNFSTVSPGSFILLNGGVEFLITSVTDNTHLVVNTTPGTLTGAAAAIGPGDLVSVLSASNNVISNNSILGGAGGGIVISNFVAGESAQKNLVVGNMIRGAGEGCIELEGENTFGTQVFDNQIRGNAISNCGLGGAASASATLYGIALIEFNSSTLLNTFIDDNYVRDDQGTPTTLNWLGITSVAAGQVFVGRNTQVGTTNVGIAGGISSVTLSAGWGTTASTSNVVSYGSGFILTVSSSGTGQAANPTVTVNTRVTTSDNPPVMSCKYYGGTGTLAPVYGESPGTNATSSSILFAFNATPVAGQTYSFLCRG